MPARRFLTILWCGFSPPFPLRDIWPDHLRGALQTTIDSVDDEVVSGLQSLQERNPRRSKAGDGRNPADRVVIPEARVSDLHAL